MKSYTMENYSYPHAWPTSSAYLREWSLRIREEMRSGPPNHLKELAVGNAYRWCMILHNSWRGFYRFREEKDKNSGVTWQKGSSSIKRVSWVGNGQRSGLWWSGASLPNCNRQCANWWCHSTQIWVSTLSWCTPRTQQRFMGLDSKRF
jgi:hypothetical protein